MLIVDAQIHLWNAGNPTSPWHRQIPAYLKDDALEEMDAAGVDVSETPDGLSVTRRLDRARAVDVTTAVFPGFPTDLQAQMMALATVSDGTTVVTETIFENRFMHAVEFMRLGADISRVKGAGA